jgi:hypothetical protein
MSAENRRLPDISFEVRVATSAVVLLAHGVGRESRRQVLAVLDRSSSKAGGRLLGWPAPFTLDCKGEPPAQYPASSCGHNVVDPVQTPRRSQGPLFRTTGRGSGEGFAVDGSMIVAGAHRQCGVETGRM